jgi:hypothetical protein
MPLHLHIHNIGTLSMEPSQQMYLMLISGRPLYNNLCTQLQQSPYKRTNDVVLDNPAAVVGVDENQDVPPLEEIEEVQNQLYPASPISIDSSEDAMDVDKKNCQNGCT